MNSRHLLFFAFSFLSIISYSQKSNDSKAYKFTIDLVNVNNDRIKVDLLTPRISTDDITYHLPKIVPGMYTIDDFGRYVEQLKAFDKNGVELTVTRTDVNSWKISHATKLFKLSYFVNDTFDDDTTKQVIFEPGGSDIQKDTVYVLNNHCYLGYFEDMKNIPYEVYFIHPANMYGSTALIDQDNSSVKDKFVTESYNQIVDNPILYDVPDTTVIKVGQTSVLISVYSPHKAVTSAFLAKKLDTLLKAQTKYLGGKLPVNKYAFLVFLSDKPSLSGSEGALEHSYSSLYYFGERDSNQLSQSFVNDAAHEFFHILTPLSIHSEEIQFFNFDKPKMSEHLWLYEGSTEYHAHMVQEKYGIITPDQLLNVLSGMITASRTQYNDTLPFTVMSSGVVGDYKEQYANVYQKGALITMCLDIKLLQLSNGKYGFINLIHDLSAKYGKQKGFKDEELFDAIEKITYPEIKVFLNTYVSGNKPLPLESYFEYVGVDFIPVLETKDSTFSLGRASLNYNPGTNRVFIADTSNMNPLGIRLGYHKKDEIISINGEEINGANAGKFFRSFGHTAKPGDSLIIKVMRNINGTDSVLELKATMTKYPIIKHNVLTFSQNPSPQQAELRNAWLKPNGIQQN